MLNLLSFLRSVRIALAILIALGFAPPSAADQTIPTVAETLNDPSWAASLRQQLHGRVRLILDDIHPYVASASFIARVVQDAGKDCGTTVDSTPDSHDLHFVWIVPMTQPAYDRVYAKVRDISKAFGGVFDEQASQISSDITNRLNGVGMYNATIVGSDPSHKSVSMVFMNEKQLSPTTSRAIMEYAVFSGLTTATAYDAPIDNNDFSYLIGGGQLSDLAGDTYQHYGKLCRAIPIIQSVCKGDFGSAQPVATIQRNLANVVAACGQDSKIVNGLRGADDLIQKDHGGN